MLYNKYQIAKDNRNIDYLKNYISDKKKVQEDLALNQKDFMTAWGDTIKRFSDKLSDPTTATLDSKDESYFNEYINSCNIVGISCTSSDRDLNDRGYDYFDVAIIDEVSKATPPELLVRLLKARKIILCGDHRQLPPMFKEHEKSYQEMVDDVKNATQNDQNNIEDARNISTEDDSLKGVLTQENFNKYKKMVTASLFKEYFENAPKSIKESLVTQYRMHHEIMDVINRFYPVKNKVGGLLECGLTGNSDDKIKSHGLHLKKVNGGGNFVEPRHHVYWVDSSSYDQSNGSEQNFYETYFENSTSACNIFEMHLIIKLVKMIASEYKNMGHTNKNPVSVGIISFYQRQVNEIRSMIRELKKSFDLCAIDIDVNTVDRFQGKEKNIIITSLVRNNKKGVASRHVVTYERINVAFSRAQNLLFIVGATHTYTKLKIEIPLMNGESKNSVNVYQNIMDDLISKNCFITSGDILTYSEFKNALSDYITSGGKK